MLGLQTRRSSNHSAAHVGESNSRSNVFQIVSCFRLRAQPLKNSAGRVPQTPPDFRKLYCLKWAKSVEKRHGLPISEARRCSACANPFACPAVEKFCRASSAGPPTALAIKFRQSDRVGHRGLSEPGGIFSRLLTYAWAQKWFVQNFAAE